jgi:hypothetical protein
MYVKQRTREGTSQRDSSLLLFLLFSCNCCYTFQKPKGPSHLWTSSGKLYQFHQSETRAPLPTAAWQQISAVLSPASTFYGRPPETTSLHALSPKHHRRRPRVLRWISVQASLAAGKRKGVHSHQSSIEPVHSSPAPYKNSPTTHPRA